MGRHGSELLGVVVHHQEQIHSSGLEDGRADERLEIKHASDCGCTASGKGVAVKGVRNSPS
jgi:hypothetical protein